MDTELLSLLPEKWRGRISVRAIYFSAMACAVLLCVLYLASLSVGISYDGHVYIDLANMFGTARFHAEWNPYRTPLFPLALKISFWLFGQQALALEMVMSTAGVAGILILGIIVKEMAGYIAGALIMIVVSLYPTFVGYERMVLTETGNFLFIALMVLLSIQTPQDTGRAWLKTAGLILVCSASYYWRQNLLSLVYWLAFLHLLAWRSLLRRSSLGRSSSEGKAASHRPSPGLALALSQCLLIVLLPNIAVQLWAPSSNNAKLLDVMLGYGVVKQALPDPKDPFIGPDEQAYESAIQNSVFHGHLYSGIRADLDNSLSDRLFSRYSGSVRDLFIRLIRDYPGRYAAAAGRTLMLFAGAKGLQDENEIFRDEILSPSFAGARIGDGPAAVTARNKEYFAQKTQPSAVQALLRLLVRLYDPILPAAFIICALGVALSIVWLDYKLFVFTATPLVYLLPYIVILSSVDRYAFPVYPFVLASPLVVGAAVAKRMLAGRENLRLEHQPVSVRGAKSF
jgi:hypothetical protein